MTQPNYLQAFGASILASEGLGNALQLASAAAAALPKLAKSPGQWESIVSNYVGTMQQIEQGLNKLTKSIADAEAVGVPADVVMKSRVKLREFAAKYQVLSEGFWKQAKAAQPGEQITGQPVSSMFGAVWVPVAIVGGVVVGIGAIAWAYVSGTSAGVLRDDIALQERELAARIEAMRQGTQLQQPTLPRLDMPAGGSLPQLPKPDNGYGIGAFLALTGALAVGGYVLSQKGKKLF